MILWSRIRLLQSVWFLNEKSELKSLSFSSTDQLDLRISAFPLGVLGREKCFKKFPYNV